MSTGHVHPVNDLVEHQLGEDCPCGPRTEPVMRDDGSSGWLVVHSSLDGREHGTPEQQGAGWFVTVVDEALDDAEAR